MDWPAFARGAGMGASLIVAIGAQNAFVLRQALHRSHVPLVVLVCIVGDMVLITAGVAGIGGFITRWEWLLQGVTWAGAAYVAWFGISSLRRALRRSHEALDAAGTNEGSASRVLRTALALTFLNPHVYLDTVVLLGSIATREGGGRYAFGAGAALSSCAWFSILGFGARALAPWFARPVTWRALDAMVGGLMLVLAVSLIT
jgi:L-lysine exporter family protein LysE/ArgO